MAERYFVRFRGRMKGPFTFDQLRQMRQRGQLSRMHEVSTDAVHWQAAATVAQFFPPEPRPASPPGDAPRRDEQDRVDLAHARHRPESPLVASSHLSAVPAGGAFDHAGAHAAATPPSPDAPMWHYLLDERTYGPVPASVILQLARDHRLTATHQIWRPGMTNWMPLNRTELGDRISAHPLDPGEAPGKADADRPAGFWLRTFAASLDGALLIPAYLAGGILLPMAGLTDPSHVISVTGALLLLLGWLYFAGFECSRMQATPGKKAMHLSVGDARGQRISFGRATARFAAKLLSAVPFMIGFLAVALTHHKRALHDMLTETFVRRG